MTKIRKYLILVIIFLSSAAVHCANNSKDEQPTTPGQWQEGSTRITLHGSANIATGYGSANPFPLSDPSAGPSPKDQNSEVNEIVLEFEQEKEGVSERTPLITSQKNLIFQSSPRIDPSSMVINPSSIDDSPAVTKVRLLFCCSCWLIMMACIAWGVYMAIEDPGLPSD